MTDKEKGEFRLSCLRVAVDSKRTSDGVDDILKAAEKLSEFVLSALKE